MTSGDILATLRMQAEQGISSLVIHCVNRMMLDGFRRKKRVLGMVSKGGPLPAHLCSSTGVRTRSWSSSTRSFPSAGSEISSSHSATRPGAGASMTAGMQCRRKSADRTWQLARRALAAGVQVIIEGGWRPYPQRPYRVHHPVLQETLAVPALCGRAAAHGYRSRIRSYRRCGRGKYCKCCRGRLSLLYHSGRTSRAAGPVCSKRGAHRIQDCSPYRGYGQVRPGCAGSGSGRAQGRPRPRRTDPVCAGSRPGTRTCRRRNRVHHVWEVLRDKDHAGFLGSARAGSHNIRDRGEVLEI